MSSHVIDGNKRNGEAECHSFRETKPHRQRPHKSRPCRTGNCIQLARADICLFKCCIDYKGDIFLMHPGSHLRHNPPILSMYRLTCHQIAQHTPILYYSGRCVIT